MIKKIHILSIFLLIYFQGLLSAQQKTNFNTLENLTISIPEKPEEKPETIYWSDKYTSGEHFIGSIEPDNDSLLLPLIDFTYHDKFYFTTEDGKNHSLKMIEMNDRNPAGAEIELQTGTLTNSKLYSFPDYLDLSQAYKNKAEKRSYLFINNNKYIKINIFVKIASKNKQADQSANVIFNAAILKFPGSLQTTGGVSASKDDSSNIKIAFFEMLKSGKTVLICASINDSIANCCIVDTIGNNYAILPVFRPSIYSSGKNTLIVYNKREDKHYELICANISGSDIYKTMVHRTLRLGNITQLAGIAEDSSGYINISYYDMGLSFCRIRGNQISSVQILKDSVITANGERTSINYGKLSSIYVDSYGKANIVFQSERSSRFEKSDYYISIFQHQDHHWNPLKFDNNENFWGGRFFDLAEDKSSGKINLALNVIDGIKLLTLKNNTVKKCLFQAKHFGGNSFLDISEIDSNISVIYFGNDNYWRLAYKNEIGWYNMNIGGFQGNTQAPLLQNEYPAIVYNYNKRNIFFSAIINGKRELIWLKEK